MSIKIESVKENVETKQEGKNSLIPQKCTDCLLSYSFSIIFVSITLALDSSYIGTTLCYYYLYYFYYFYYYHSKLH